MQTLDPPGLHLWRRLMHGTVLASAVLVLAIGAIAVGCAKKPGEREPIPDTRVSLASQGLPPDFFAPHAEDRCAGKVVVYRFVTWITERKVVVGFSTSPSCKPTLEVYQDGVIRLLAFDVDGKLTANRDVPYEASAGPLVVAKGEGTTGPASTVLIRIQELVKSKSSVLLFDENLNEAARVNRFIEEPTFVSRSLVYQEPHVPGIPRTYVTLRGSPPTEIARWTQWWPIDTMGRKFGERGVAYLRCEQELQPNVWAGTDVIYSTARRRCSLVVQNYDKSSWQLQVCEGRGAMLVGMLDDSGVAGIVYGDKGQADRLQIWHKDAPAISLPWLPAGTSGDVVSATPDLGRYATFVIRDRTATSGRWIIFDRKRQAPIVNRELQTNARAALAPDGTRYATFESGELRIYSLPVIE